MWDWWCCSFNPSSNKKHHPFSLPFLSHHNHQNLLPIQQVQEENDDPDGPPNHPLSAFAMIFTSWLRRSTSRYLILALCSPFLLPLFCATFPFICALEVFFRLCRRRRLKRRSTMDGCDGDRMRQSEDGANGGRLLQRYLEDQLILVAGSVYECGDDDDDDEEDDVVDVQYFDNTSPSLQ